MQCTSAVEPHGGRLAIEATMEPSSTKGGCGVWHSLDAPAATTMWLSCIFATAVEILFDASPPLNKMFL